MKALSLVVGVLGMLAMLAAVIGRFLGTPTITFPLLGEHTGAAVLTAGNSLLMVGVFLLALNLQPKDR